MANGLAISGGGTNYWTASGANLSPDSVAGYANVNLASAGLYQWNADLALARLGAASMRQGLAPSATPVAQVFTLGEASIPGTSANIGGSSGTLRSGLGTGTGTASSLIFQTPTLAGAGTGAQAYATRLTVATAAVTSTVPVNVAREVYVGLTGGGASGAIYMDDASGGLVIQSGNPLVFAGALAGVALGSGMAFSWDASATGATGTPDLRLARLAAASLVQGKAPSATPVAQVFTLGEASIPGTSANIGGSSGTLRPGLGTGTGTASSLIFQTPTLAGAGTGAQAYATRLTIATTGITPTVPLLAPDGAVGAPSISFSGDPNTGIYRIGADSIGFAANGALIFSMDGTAGVVTSVAPFYSKLGYFGFQSGGDGYVLISTTTAGTGIMIASGAALGSSPGISIGSALGLGWTAGADGYSTAFDTAFYRLAAASVRQGNAPSATPVNQTFTLGEASRPGTDNNVGGASGVFRCGLGTGTGAAASLSFQTPDLVGAGSGVQTYATRLTLSQAGAVFDLVDQGFRINGQVSGAGASVGTLTNAPAAGNPTFWLPISIAGVTAYFPGW